MKSILIVGIVLVMFFVLLSRGVLRGQAAELKPGDPAPAFALPGSDGQTYSLADFKGKKAVVLAWFPKAFTGG